MEETKYLFPIQFEQVFTRVNLFHININLVIYVSEAETDGDTWQISFIIILHNSYSVFSFNMYVTIDKMTRYSLCSCIKVFMYKI